MKSEACNVMLRYLIMRMNQILSCENLFTRSMKITQKKSEQSSYVLNVLPSYTISHTPPHHHYHHHHKGNKKG